MHLENCMKCSYCLESMDVFEKSVQWCYRFVTSLIRRHVTYMFVLYSYVLSGCFIQNNLVMYGNMKYNIFLSVLRNSPCLSDESLVIDQFIVVCLDADTDKQASDYNNWILKIDYCLRMHILEYYFAKWKVTKTL